MNTIRVCDLRASALLLFAALCSLAPVSLQAQFATSVDTGTRYAGNSTGTNIFSGDSGAANTTALSAPSYSVLDASGNLFLSDTSNNCVRKIDTAGNITTVAGLRVNGGPDTCNTTANPTPAPTEGLYKPTGLAIDSAGTLYISDSLHNCVRSLASGAVDSFAANALTTVAGTCTATDTASVTPVPDGLALDSARNLYISIRDSAAATPVNQVLRHAFGSAATSVCYVAGQPSANVASACPGITGTATLSSPGGLAIDLVGNLFIADTGNSCVREVAGLTTLKTAVGVCANDASTGVGSLQSPSGLAITPANALLISQSAALQNSVVSFSSSSGTLTQIAGLPSGASGPYSSLSDGQSALSTPLNTPLGLTTDSLGNIYLADSANNVIRKLTSNLNFGSIAVGGTSATQTVTFQINAASNLTASIGADYGITANTCAGAQTPSSGGQPPATCQVTVAFSPTRPGTRSSALKLKDSVSGSQISVALNGTGVGSLSLFTPGIVNTLAANLRAPIAVSVDSSGNTYVLEQGDAASTADVLLYPAGGGSPAVVVPQGSGLSTPTAMSVDAAGNIFIAEASSNTIIRFGANGSVNTTYITGVPSVSALAIDAFDNLYIAQAGSVHTVIESYAGGGSRIIAGSGATAHADNVSASSALFIKPSGLALGPNGLAIADASDQYVYTVDSTGTIHIVAGNGTSSSTNIALATGTAILNPNGLAYDAAGDLYIADQSANLVYEVFPFQSSGSNISVAVGTGGSGYSGDGGSAAVATLNGPFTVALDGSANLYIVDYGNNALREVTYLTSRTIDFGHVVIGNNPTKTQTLANAGNAPLSITAPFTPTDPHYTTTGPTTTCANSLANGGFCNIGYTFTPTTQGQFTATSTVTSNAYDSPQTVNLNAFAIVTQPFPYTLSPETEVYGSSFVQTVTINVNYPDLPPTGTISYTISGNQTCSKTANSPSSFSGTINCSAADSFLHVLQSPYTVNFIYASGDIDYSSTTGTTSLTVTPAAMTVTSPNITVPYGAGFTFPTPAAAITGLVNGDAFIPTDTTTGSKTSPPGTYPITTALTPAGAASTTDYNITYVPGVLTITQATLSVTPTNISRQYGLANPTLTGNVVGTQNNDTFTVTYSTTATPTSPVGNYPITATITGTNIADYTVTLNVGTLTVTPAPLTVNVASATRPYGTANPTFTATTTGTLYNGDTFSQNVTTSAAQFSPVGTYPITDAVTGAATSNYAITVNPGTLTVTQANAVVNVVAANATRTYGAVNPPFTSTTTGTLNGDTFTITYTTPATVTSPIGTYPITPVASGPNAANYNVIATNGALTVTPAALTVAANNASRPYNTANPAFTATSTGLLNGDALTVTYATPATLTSPVGTYPIVPTVTGAALSNYSLTTASGVLSITPSVSSPLTITVNSATRAYGAANPVFTGAVSGLLNGDTVTVAYTTAATSTSAPGTYPVTAIVSGAAAANYTVNIAPGALVVTQAGTTVNLGTSSSPAFYGASLTFTATVSAATGTPTGTVTFRNGTTVLGTAPLGANGIATYSTSSLNPGSLTITASYSGDANFTASTANIAQVITAGSFTLAASPASQFVRGAGSTTYTITATSAQGFNGPVSLSCAGLPSDATCTFAKPILTVAAGGSATTTMTVTNTAADAKLEAPQLPTNRNYARYAPVAFAAVFPFELTGLGVLFAGTRRKRRFTSSARSPKLRLLLLLLCTAGLMGLAGCACFTSVYQNYTVNVTGTSTVPGVASQSTSVILSVGQQ